MDSTVPSSILVRGIADERLIPPIFFFLTVTSGIDSLGLIPIFRSSSRITGRCWGLNTSRTTTIKSELRDTESISSFLYSLKAAGNYTWKIKNLYFSPFVFHDTRNDFQGRIHRSIFDSALVSWFKMVDFAHRRESHSALQWSLHFS